MVEGKQSEGEVLKPCPFGCEAHPYPAETARVYDRFAVHCPTCHITGPRRDNLDAAIAAWNRRPTVGKEREGVIEECARVAERYPMVNGEGYDGNDIAEHIRALSSPPVEGRREEKN